MNLPVLIRREAERDLEDAATWYEEQQLGLGREFLDEVSHTLQLIAEQPDLYPVLHRSTRRALTRRFPFGIYYLPQTNRMVVVAVLHGSRDPRHWKQRT